MKLQCKQTWWQLTLSSAIRCHWFSHVDFSRGWLWLDKDFDCFNRPLQCSSADKQEQPANLTFIEWFIAWESLVIWSLRLAKWFVSTISLDGIEYNPSIGSFCGAETTTQSYDNWHKLTINPMPLQLDIPTLKCRNYTWINREKQTYQQEENKKNNVTIFVSLTWLSQSCSTHQVQQKSGLTTPDFVWTPARQRPGCETTGV